MKRVVISGTGLWKPSEVLTNEELVASYNAYADLYNSDLDEGDLGLICSFGAGYSIGSVLIRKC